MDRERADLVETLRGHRGFLTYTTRDLTDEQAALTPTVSVLSIGGLIKHVTSVERGWLAFALGGAEAMQSQDSDWENGFRMVGDETLASLLAAYESLAAETDAHVEKFDDLDREWPLPVAPWFEAGKCWSIRRVLLHLIAETSQHAGHADIIREAIDGSKTMG